MVCSTLHFIPIIAINITVFWIITQYRLVHINPCFGAACCLQFKLSPKNVVYCEDEDSTDILVQMYLSTRSDMPETGIFIITRYYSSDVNQETRSNTSNTSVKGKESPNQALRGPQGSRRLSSQDFQMICT